MSLTSDDNTFECVVCLDDVLELDGTFSATDLTMLQADTMSPHPQHVSCPVD